MPIKCLHIHYCLVHRYTVAGMWLHRIHDASCEGEVRRATVVGQGHSPTFVEKPVIRVSFLSILTVLKPDIECRKIAEETATEGRMMEGLTYDARRGVSSPRRSRTTELMAGRRVRVHSQVSLLTGRFHAQLTLVCVNPVAERRRDGW